ncbi:unnamed protein product [Thelazia callipaeda]|uniref:Cadherin_C domain-containing protein n=1 Tax=Thelazia callipaeda TaxID=103827 RepID=A0A0N5D291_THECL|nr:unnamed protein product [Thelazia callipaeda]
MRPDFCLFLSYTVILCNPLLPDKPAISVFNSSVNKAVFSTFTSFHYKTANVTVTPPPYRILGSAVSAPNAVREIEKEVISTLDKDIIKYSSDNKHEMDTHYVHEETKERASFNHDRSIRNGQITIKASDINFKISTNNNQTNNSISTPINSSATQRYTDANVIFKSINNLHGKEVDLDLEVTVLVLEIFNAVAPFLSLLSIEANITDYKTPSSNSSIIERSNKQSPYEESKHKEKNWNSKMFRSNSERIEISSVEEKSGNKRKHNAGSTEVTQDYIFIKGEQNIERFKINSKFSPQVISSSKLAKNDLKEQQMDNHYDCDVNHLRTLKGDFEKKKLSCGLNNQTKSLKLPSPEMHTTDDDDEQHNIRRTSQPVMHFERTLWEKLIAGLKCSQRDCRDALRPTENIRKYLIEPSISRARKHGYGRRSHLQS